jgi:hypothetical protein
LLREQELTLTKAESICRAAEVSEQQMKTISADMTSMAVSAIKKPSQEEENKPSCRYCGKNMPSVSVQHMARSVANVKRKIILLQFVSRRSRQSV